MISTVIIENEITFFVTSYLHSPKILIVIEQKNVMFIFMFTGNECSFCTDIKGKWICIYIALFYSYWALKTLLHYKSHSPIHTHLHKALFSVQFKHFFSITHTHTHNGCIKGNLRLNILPGDSLSCGHGIKPPASQLVAPYECLYVVDKMYMHFKKTEPWIGKWLARIYRGFCI